MPHKIEPREYPLYPNTGLKSRSWIERRKIRHVLDPEAPQYAAKRSQQQIGYMAAKSHYSAQAKRKGDDDKQRTEHNMIPSKVPKNCELLLEWIIWIKSPFNPSVEYSRQSDRDENGDYVKLPGDSPSYDRQRLERLAKPPNETTLDRAMKMDSFLRMVRKLHGSLRS